MIVKLDAVEIGALRLPVIQVLVTLIDCGFNSDELRVPVPIGCLAHLARRHMQDRPAPSRAAARQQRRLRLFQMGR